MADISVAPTTSAPTTPTTMRSAITRRLDGRVQRGWRCRAWQDRAMPHDVVVAGLWRHPVKSMQGEALQTALLERDGIAGDRRRAVVDRASGLVLNAKREGRLLEASARAPSGNGSGIPLVTVPGHDEGAADDPALDGWLSAWLGRGGVIPSPRGVQRAVTAMPADFEDDSSDGVEWRMRPGRFHDLAPVHVLTTASLRAMAAAAPDLDWRVRRFRPTIMLDVDGADGLVEQDWVGARLRIGDTAIVTVRKLTVRCVMTTRPQPRRDGDDGIDRQLDVLRTLHARTDSCLGVYGNVDTPGTINVGDPVTIDPGPD